MAYYGMGDLVEEVAQVRALRAAPPGKAATDPKRARTFGAALEQFEQLLMAGKGAGTASSPLLLFYALSQAGRAVVAAHGEQGEAFGHGLKASPREPIGETTIEPAKPGLFQAVAVATGSQELTARITLAEMWAAIPWIRRAPGLAEDAPPTLQVSDTGTGVGLTAVRDSFANVEEFEAVRAQYPALAGLRLEPVQSSNGTVIVKVAGYESGEQQAAFEAAILPFLGGRYLRVPLGPNADQPSALMLWWIALLALSQLARYDSAAWTAALVPEVETAVPLEQTLRYITQMLPRLILHALTERR